MKILMAGAGAVGGYYGAMLARSGQDVTLLARGKTLEVLRSNKLRVNSYEGDFEIQLKVVESIDEMDAADLIIITTKTYDTDTILQQIKPLVGENTLLLSLQNGVETELKMVAYFDKHNVLGGICYIGAEVTEPGTIVHSADGQIAIGELSGEQSERVQAIATIFGKAGIRTTLSTDIQRLLWKKLLWNAPFNQVCAIARSSVGDILDSPEMWDLLRAVGHEVVTLAQANDVPLTEEDIEEHLTFSDEKLRSVRPSLLQDLERGKRLEHETFGGYLVREGRRLNIPTPVNETLYQLLCFLDTAR